MDIVPLYTELTNINTASNELFIVNGELTWHFNYMDWSGKVQTFIMQSRSYKIKCKVESPFSGWELYIYPDMKKFALARVNNTGQILESTDFIDNAKIIGSEGEPINIRFLQENEVHKARWCSRNKLGLWLIIFIIVLAICSILTYSIYYAYMSQYTQQTS